MKKEVKENTQKETETWHVRGANHSLEGAGKATTGRLDFV